MDHGQVWCESVYCIQVVESNVQRRAIVNTVMEIEVT